MLTTTMITTTESDLEHPIKAPILLRTITLHAFDDEPGERVLELVGDADKVVNIRRGIRDEDGGRRGRVEVRFSGKEAPGRLGWETFRKPVAVVVVVGCDVRRDRDDVAFLHVPHFTHFTHVHDRASAPCERSDHPDSKEKSMHRLRCQPGNFKF